MSDDRFDGDPAHLAPDLYAWLQPREQASASSYYREHAVERAKPAYGMLDAEDLETRTLHPTYESAVSASRAAVAAGARNAYVLWHAFAWAGSVLLALPLLLLGTWPSVLGGLALLAAGAASAWKFTRRLRTVRRAADDEYFRLARIRAGGTKTPPTLPAPARRRAWFPGWAVAMALALGVALFGYGGDDVLETRGWPTEHAQVLATKAAGSGCGRGSSPRDITWRSADPPAGLPATFTDEESCDTSDVGDHSVVVRVVHADGDVEVHVDPVRSWGDAVGLGALAALLTLAVTCLGSGLWARRSRRAHSSD